MKKFWKQIIANFYIDGKEGNNKKLPINPSIILYDT